ncbi:MAG: hypothetical protein ABJL67_02330 [Sulfitobacter sp.]
MNVKIERILAAEAQVITIQSDETKLRREFMSDGTIDADEQSQLDKVNRNIQKLETLINDLREEVETNRRIWEGRARDYSQVRSRLDDLLVFAHPDAAPVQSEVEAIEPLVADQCWADATTALDQAEVTLEPVYANYLEQIAARDTYDPLRADCDARLIEARAASPSSDEVAAQIEQVENSMAAVDGHVEARDYLQALPMCEEIANLLNQIEAELARLEQLKEQYEREWAALQPRLQQVAVCIYPDLVPMQEDILALSDSIQEHAGAENYEEALTMITDLSTRLDSFLTAFEESASEQELYESRLPSVDAELAQTRTSEFDELVPLQNEINATAERMRGAASNADYETALTEMDALVALLETYLVELGTARLRREYEELLAAFAPQLDSIMISTYPILQDQVRAIEAARAAAETAAGAGDYVQAIAKLNEAVQLLGQLEQAIAMQDAARAEYDGRVGDILARCDAIASCSYPQLAGDHQNLLDARAQLDELVAQGDYISAISLLNEIVDMLQFIEETRDRLQLLETEYETRLPAIITRFDSLMQCDFAELETVRQQLMTDRTAMESAAGERDFEAALDLLNKIERDLNTLDARIGDLEALRTQYEELLASIQGQLDDVEACDHEELATKRSEILALRDEMLAAAEATDFALAIQKANALVPLLAEFAQLEVLLAEYKRRLPFVETRLETMRGFTYLSLEDDKAEIESLYTAMQTDAAAANLRDALAKLEQIETKLTAIEALNHQLMLKEAVYEQLASDMAAEIETIRGNSIEQAQTAADKVIRAHDEMVRLGEAHEFVDAVTKAEEVNALIDVYLAKVDEFGDAEEAYNIVRPMAEAAHAQAQEKAEEFDELSDQMEGLDRLKTEMEAAAADNNFEEAKAKANQLLRDADSLSSAHRDLLVRRESLLAEARTAIGEFDGIDSEAEDRAASEFEAAEDAKSTLEDAMEDSDLEALEDALSDFRDKVRALEDALKSDEELEAQYEGVRDQLQRQKQAAHGSPHAEDLADALDAIDDAFETMEGTANDDKDYRRALREADAVETALTDFNRAEGILSGQKVRFEERMNGLGTVYGRAAAVTTPDELADRAGDLRDLHQEALDLAADGEYEDALNKATDVRTEAQAILDEQERLEDEAAAETERELEEERAREDDCSDDDTEGGEGGDFVDDVEDLVRDPTGTVSDWIEGDHGLVGELLENAAQEVLEHIPNPPISEIIDEVADIKDKVDEVVEGYERDQ